MSAPVRIERVAWTDGRFGTLARLIGVDRYSALGRMAALWAEATERHTDRLSPALIAGILECDPGDVARIMVTAELGELVDDAVIRLRGGEERLAWLGQRREAGARGGSKRPGTRSGALSLPKPRAKRPKKVANPEQTPSKPEANPEQAPSKPEANTNPPVSGLQVIGSGLSGSGLGAPPPAGAPPSPHRAFIEWFTARFRKHHQAEPTWDGKTARAVKELLEKHPPAEVRRRAEIMFASAPDFPATHPDMSTLRQFFDRFASPTKARGSPGGGRNPERGLSAADLLEFSHAIDLENR